MNIVKGVPFLLQGGQSMGAAQLAGKFLFKKVHYF